MSFSIILELTELFLARCMTLVFLSCLQLHKRNADYTTGQWRLYDRRPSVRHDKGHHPRRLSRRIFLQYRRSKAKRVGGVLWQSEADKNGKVAPQNRNQSRYHWLGKANGMHWLHVHQITRLVVRTISCCEELCLEKYIIFNNLCVYYINYTIIKV